MTYFKRPNIDYETSPEVIELGLNKESIFQIAERTLSALKFDPSKDETSSSILNLIKLSGGRVHYFNSYQIENHGKALIHGPKDYDLLVSEIMTPYRFRFTLVHRLATYILHSKLGKNPVIIPWNGISARTEWECNWFAWAFLMPERKFREVYNQTEYSIKEVSSYFHVQHEDAKRRVSDLKLHEPKNEYLGGYIVLN